MKNYDNEMAVAQTEQHIRHLYKQYENMVNEKTAFNELKAIRMQIKHAEESLRLKKRIHALSLR